MANQDAFESSDGQWYYFDDELERVYFNFGSAIPAGVASATYLDGRKFTLQDNQYVLTSTPPTQKVDVYQTSDGRWLIRGSDAPWHMYDGNGIPFGPSIASVHFARGDVGFYSNGKLTFLSKDDDRSIVINADGSETSLYAVPPDWKRRYAELGLTEDREQDYYNLLAERGFSADDVEGLKKALQRPSTRWIQPTFADVFPKLKADYPSATKEILRRTFLDGGTYRSNKDIANYFATVNRKGTFNPTFDTLFPTLSDEYIDVSRSKLEAAFDAGLADSGGVYNRVTMRDYLRQANDSGQFDPTTDLTPSLPPVSAPQILNTDGTTSVLPATANQFLDYSRLRNIYGTQYTDLALSTAYERAQRTSGLATQEELYRYLERNYTQDLYERFPSLTRGEVNRYVKDAVDAGVDSNFDMIQFIEQRRNKESKTDEVGVSDDGVSDNEVGVIDDEVEEDDDTLVEGKLDDDDFDAGYSSSDDSYGTLLSEVEYYRNLPTEEAKSNTHSTGLVCVAVLK